MKCPTCVEEGQRSRVFPVGKAKPLVHWTPFWDEDGVFHKHDPTDKGKTFRCSLGHRWTEDPEPCPAPGCPWPNKELPQ